MEGRSIARYRTSKGNISDHLRTSAAQMRVVLTNLASTHFSGNLVYQARRANFALVVDMNASSKEHQAQYQSPENKHNN